MREDLRRHIRRSLSLLPIPILFIVLSELGGLQFLQNTAMDWRFAIRGPVETPDVKLIYVNLDDLAIKTWGEKPFPRDKHADTARAVLEMGGASAVFYDVIFSPIATSGLVPKDVITMQDEILGAAVREHLDKIVLASAYSGTLLPTPTVAEGATVPVTERAFLPLIGAGNYDPQTNPPPELPGYPVYNPNLGGQEFEGSAWGRTAFINIAYVRGAGATLRWLPAYVETNNEHYTRLYLESLLASLQRNPGGMALVADYTELHAPAGAEKFQLKADRIVLGDVVTEMETEICTVPAVVPRTFTAACVDLVLAQHGLTSDQALRIDPGRDSLDVVDPNNGDALLHRIPLTDGQLIEINWFSPWATPVPAPEGTLGALDDDGFQAALEGHPPAVQEAMLRMQQAEYSGLYDPYNPRISMVYVVELYHLAQADADAAELIRPWMRKHFEGRMVLVGATDPIMQDVGPTPMDPDPVPRVSAHGNAVKTILTGNYIVRPPPWAMAVITLLLTVIVSELLRYTGRNSRAFKVAGAGMLVLYIACTFIAFNVANLAVPFVTPVVSAFTASAIGLGTQLLEEEKRRGRLKGMFSTYLAPALVDRMAESGEEPRLGGEVVEITALFSDIQSFSSFSELLPPTKLVDLMNEYLTAMTDVIQERGATLDKYIGDAIVAMFGAPLTLEDHAYRACLAAARMQERQAELRAKWIAEGQQWPAIVGQMRTRIGLNTGSVVVGNMGSQTRFNYTMMGDDVNLAARCESGAKSAGVYTLITEATKLAAERHGNDIVFRYVDRWKVKGRNKPVSMYEVMGLRSSLPATAIECRDLYEEALRLYFERDFGRAITLLEQAAKLEPYHPDRVPESPTAPSLVLLERCRAMRLAPPPPEWDGVYVMKTK